MKNLLLKINIIGDGVFGTFLKHLFEQSKNIEISELADIVILAVPFDAYDEVASQHKDKLLVNVCSVQEDTNEICLKYSNDVLGMHPLFGERTPKEMDRICLVTHTSSTEWACEIEEDFLLMLALAGIDCIGVKPGGGAITAVWHDELMAKSHLKALSIAEGAAADMLEILDIPDAYLPASVVRLRDLVLLLQDMPEGTRDSIRANKYVEKQS